MKKNLIQFCILFLYIALVLFSIILSIKPGSSIFYYKIKLDPNLIRPDIGFAYRYPIKADSFLFPPDRAILMEDNQALKKDSPTRLTDEGNGLFSIPDPSPKTYYLYFAPTDNSDPSTNGKTYTVFLPVILFSRAKGLLYLSMLSLLLAWFTIFIIKSPERRRSFQANGFISLLNVFIKQELLKALLAPTNTDILTLYRAAIWKKIFTWIILAAYIYVASEWLFFITKPSFFNLIAPIEKFEIFLQAGFLLAFTTLVIAVLFWVLDSFLVLLHKNGFPLYLSTILPGAIIACLSLLMLDNFTYTLFSIGVVSTEGIWRVFYAALFIMWFLFLQRQILKSLGLRGTKKISLAQNRLHFYANYGLLIISSLLILSRVDFSLATEMISKEQVPKISSRPNILLLGSDGLNAANLSIYGYERDTTPTLLELSSSSLIAENAFTNAAQSSGSVLSILNSRLPTQTRVLNTPDILKGKDSFLHLPGILKREGYYTAQIGLVHYIDAYNLNMKYGFDLVNNRTLGENIYSQNIHNSSLDDTLYFANLLIERIFERLQHIFFIQKMENPISQVIGFEDFHRDGQRIENLLDIITYTDEPFFVHAHLMVTHGAEFFPPVQWYSLGQAQTEEWMTDFYDDAVLSFDTYLRVILETLEESGKLENTILILYTDHGQMYLTNVRIPLIFRFPSGAYAGRLKANAQNLDIAPTILDYLNIPIPNWMEGSSLLQNDIPQNRLILASSMKMDRSDKEVIRPPFYQFGLFTLIQCNHWYQYNVELATWMSGDIADHTAPCSPEEPVFSSDEIKQVLADHLSSNLFDISGLP